MSGITVENTPKYQDPEPINNMTSLERHMEPLSIRIAGSGTDEACSNDTQYVVLLDCVVVEDIKQATQRDLYKAPSDQCYLDHIQLIPTDPNKWVNRIAENKCLKTTLTSANNDPPLALRCEWPKMGSEWIQRNRPNNWPHPTIVENIRNCGLRIVPNTESSGEDVWRYSFTIAETKLIQLAVTKEQLDCLNILKLVLDDLGVSKVVGLCALMHTFFYFCEETQHDMWVNKPGNCIVSFMQRLITNVERRSCPHYFIKILNMFDDGITDDQMLWCRNRLSIARRHPFVTLFIICDGSPYSVVSTYHMFERLIEHFHSYGIDQDIQNAIHDCFLPVATDGMRRLVTAKRYDEAFKQGNAVLRVLQNMCNAFNQDNDDLIITVMSKCFVEESWLFAFYLDVEDGSNFLRVYMNVNMRDMEIVPISTVFGPALDDYLARMCPYVLPLHVPAQLTSLEKISNFALGLCRVMQQLRLPLKTQYDTLMFYHARWGPNVKAYTETNDLSIILQTNLLRTTSCIFEAIVQISKEMAAESETKIIENTKKLSILETESNMLRKYMSM